MQGSLGEKIGEGVDSTGEALRDLKSLTSSCAGIIARSAVICASPAGAEMRGDGLH